MYVCIKFNARILISTNCCFIVRSKNVGPRWDAEPSGDIFKHFSSTSLLSLLFFGNSTFHYTQANVITFQTKQYFCLQNNLYLNYSFQNTQLNIFSWGKHISVFSIASQPPLCSLFISQ